MSQSHFDEAFEAYTTDSPEYIADSQGEGQADSSRREEAVDEDQESSRAGSEDVSEVGTDFVKYDSASPEPAETTLAVTESFSRIGRNQLASFKDFQGKFAGIEEVEQYLRSKHRIWAPASRVVPNEQTEGGRQKIRQCVEDVYDAMVSMSSHNDNSPEKGRRSVSIMTPGKISDALVEARSWQVVYAAIALHRDGSCVPKSADISSKDDKDLTFVERIAAICEALRTWKSCAQDCIDGTKLQLVVHAPKTSITRKANNKRNNTEKGMDLKLGAAARKAEGARREPRKRGRRTTQSKGMFDDELNYEMETDVQTAPLTAAQKTTRSVAEALKRMEASDYEEEEDEEEMDNEEEGEGEEEDDDEEE